MAGFSQGAIELKKKNLLSAAPNDFIKLSINTDNVPYTVDENGVYRYLNYYESTGISSSMLSDLIDNGNGTATILSANARLYSTNDFTGTLLEYSIPSATFTLTDGAEQYICVKYNSGTPIYYLENDKRQINESNVICVYCCWRQGNEIHSVGSDSKALGLSNKISLSITDTIPYRKSVDGGLILSEINTPSLRTVTITSAVVYSGVIKNDILSFNSSTDRLTLAYHSAGNWVYSDNLTYNNTQYDDGVNLQTIGNNKYAVRWFYRSIGDIKQCFYVLGSNQHNSISDARLESLRNDLPIVLRRHCVLTARIIIEYNASSGIVENVSDINFTTTSIQNHNDLSNIQGGSLGNYYHVSASTFGYLSAVSADIQTQLNSKISSAGSPTNHNNLINLQGGSSGNYYHVSASTFGYLSAVSADIQQQLNSKISSAAAPTNHNNLLGLQGGSSGNYYHVSASTFGYLSAVSADIQQQIDSKISTNLLGALQEPTGFITRSNTKLLFDDSTRTFTISALESTFDVYYRGNRFIKSTESIIIPNISGLHFIYYTSAGVLTQSNGIAWDIPTTIQIAIIYWTGTSSLGLCEERHGTVMDCATHAYLHTTFGTRYSSGFNSSYVLTNDLSAYFGLTNGKISDEDIDISITQGVSGNYFTQQINYQGYFPIYYRQGINGIGTWRKDPAIIYPYKNNGGTSRANFNELSGTTWIQSQSQNNYYVAYFIYATDEIYQPIISVQGQRQDSTLLNAQNFNSPSTLLFDDFPIVEAKLLYRIIIQTNASYTGNPFLCRIADVTDYRNQLDSTGSIIGGTGTVTYVGLSANPIFTIAGTPIINAGTFTIDLSAQSSGTFLAGPSIGTPTIPTFRKLTSSDIPPISNYYLPLSGGQLFGQMRGTSVSASGNISAANFNTIGSVIFKDSIGTFTGSIAGTSSDILIRNLSANGSVIDYPLVIEKTGLNRVRIGASGFVRPIELGGPITVLNLSANGFLRSNSSGLITTSPFVSSDLPSLAYLPLSGGILTGNLSALQIRPVDSFAYDLGSNTLRWNQVWSKDFYCNAFYTDSSNEIYVNPGATLHFTSSFSTTPIMHLGENLATSTILGDLSFNSGRIKVGDGSVQKTVAWTSDITSNLSILSAYLPLSGGTLTGQLKGTTISASGNISANNFVGNLTGYKNVDNGNESTIANGFGGGNLYINYRGSSSVITQYRFGDGINSGLYSGLLASAFIKSGGTSTQFLKADGSVDSNSYVLNSTLGNYLPLSGGTLTGNLTGTSFIGNSVFTTSISGTSGTFVKFYSKVSQVTNNFSISDSQVSEILYVTSSLASPTGTLIQNFQGREFTLVCLKATTIIIPTDTFCLYNGGIYTGSIILSVNTTYIIGQSSSTLFYIISINDPSSFSDLYLPLSGGTLTRNLKISAYSEGWSEGIRIMSPSNSWGGLRLSRNHLVTDTEGNWAVGYANNSSDNFEYQVYTSGVQTKVSELQKNGSVYFLGNLSANSLILPSADLATYTSGNLNPTKRIYQDIGTNDYWSIYGEGLSNDGAMILEVGDDLSETIKLRFKKTYAPYTTKTPYIFSYNSFDTIECRQRIYYDALVDSLGDYAEHALEIATNTNSGVHSYKPGIGFHSRGQYACLFYLNTYHDWKSKDDLGNTYTFYHTGNLPSVLGNYLPLSGGTMTGDISFVNSTTGVGKGIYGTNGDNDHWRIVGGSTGTNAGYLEIATDDNQTEPIYIRQYLGTFASPSSIRTLTLLDQSGNTNIPGNISATNIINRGSYYVSNYAAGGNPSLITNQGVATFYTLNLDYYNTGERSLKFADSAYLGPTFASFFNNGSSQNNAIVLKGAGNIDYAGLYFGVPTISERYIGTKGDNTLYIKGTNINTDGNLSHNGSSTFVGNHTIGRVAWPDEYSTIIYDKFYVSGTSQFNSSATFSALTKFSIGSILAPTWVNASTYVATDTAGGFLIFSDTSTTATRITLSDSIQDGKIIYIFNFSGGSRYIESTVTEGIQTSPGVQTTSLLISNASLYICIKLSSGSFVGGWKVRQL